MKIITKEEKIEIANKQEIERKVAEVTKRLTEIDTLAVRPTRAIKVAELQGNTPNSDDIQKLIDLENEAGQLRATL